MSIQRFVSYFNWVFIRYSVTRSEYQCAICETVNHEIHSLARWWLPFNFPFLCVFGIDFHLYSSYSMRVNSQADKLPPVPRHMLICLGV